MATAFRLYARLARSVSDEEFRDLARECAAILWPSRPMAIGLGADRDELTLRCPPPTAALRAAILTRLSAHPLVREVDAE